MSNRIIIILFILAIPQWLLAQKEKYKRTSKDWMLNEVYVSDSSSRYGLFVEIYNPSKEKKVTSDLYLSTEKDSPGQYRLKSKSRFHPDLKKKGYNAFKVSAVRFRSRTIRMYGQTDTLYLYKRINYEFYLTDSIPVIWNDSLSVGKCGDRLCIFNMPTPGRINKNIQPYQHMPRKLYRGSILLGTSSANNIGKSLLQKNSAASEASSYAGNNRISAFPSFGIKVQKVVNRRSFYTTTTVALFHQGYSFKGTESDSTNTGYVTRKLDGYYSAVSIWAGKDIGVFLTPRFDISIGGALVLATYARQNYDETIDFVRKSDNEVFHDHYKQKETPANYQLPVLTFNSSLNYRLTPRYKIELFYNILFRTFQKTETIYYHSINIGVSKSFRHKGRGYREALLFR